jgi:class 3 adenylate cyclase
LRVLAVDDNPENIELVSDIVESMGHEVLRAYDGFQAIDLARFATPDVILLDINMPGMNGFEVVEQLKADDRTAQIPIIMLSAQAEIDDRVQALGLGADDYLVKPFSARELAARIDARLRTKTAADQMRAIQQLIRQTFERYVSPTVVDELLRDPNRVELGGVLQQVTVLFADLQDFTLTSERTRPEMVLAMLNHYHELIVRIIQDNGGTIDKFIGDAVMALFNTPLEQDDHVLRAVRSAMQIREALPDFHLDLAHRFRLKINFGIHSGSAVVGNVGAPQIMNFTAVGDTVNVAARLQSLSHDGQILISEATYAVIENEVEVEEIGPVSFKGRSVPVMTYSVLAMR